MYTQKAVPGRGAKLELGGMDAQVNKGALRAQNSTLKRANHNRQNNHNHQHCGDLIHQPVLSTCQNIAASHKILTSLAQPHVKNRHCDHTDRF